MLANFVAVDLDVMRVQSTGSCFVAGVEIIQDSTVYLKQVFGPENTWEKKRKLRSITVLARHQSVLLVKRNPVKYDLQVFGIVDSLTTQ